jgi:hypothetical protein
MAYGPNFASKPTVGAALLTIADASRTAPSNAQTVYTPDVLGAQVERVVISPVGALTAANVVRLFRYDGATYHFYAEVGVAALTVAAALAGVTAGSLEAVDNPNLFPIAIPPGWSLKASLGATALAAEGAAGSIAAAQTTGGAAQLSLNGTGATAASAAAVAALQTLGGAGLVTLTSAAAYVMPAPAQLTLTSTGNISGVNFTIRGRKGDGTIGTEVLAGPNNNTVYSVGVYASIISISASGAVATNTSAGYSAVAPLALPSTITLASLGNLSGVNFTIIGTDTHGVTQTEVLAGPNANTVASVNSYSSITSIAAGGAVATAVQAGNPPILSGIKVQAEGGSFA